MEFLLTFLGWLGFSFLVGSFAQRRGRSFGAWMIVSLLFSPLVGVIIVLLLSPIAEKTEPAIQHPEAFKLCPRCAESVKRAALVCRFCGHEFGNTPNP
ncbi:zinc ribbon domain-containing protein [Methylobrevis pamukkalensis]|uniref:Uncharacterized protein n=1 Tax=Methylobrevis pamukkalensis TaxID=1439726 RepID=A0A1E3H1M6_9HYPH|nr:zinc ribbon domain-containing protein [Methylobrevis pamukkalensis]ODN70220.1 hypothetical protein A6302_02494 [Methylobrevis pamukkalensis]